MRRSTVARIAAGTAFILAAAILVAWLAFVPFARETGYRFQAAWGGKGAAPGQFNDPTGIAIAGAEVFVSDARNGRIQVFDLDGRFLRAFGTPGANAGELGRPMNLFVRGSELYVPEFFSDRIQVFDLSGRSRRIIGAPGDGPGQFNAPGGVAVDRTGAIYVADTYNHRVQKLAADGSFVRQWGATGEPGIRAERFSYPTDVALGMEGGLFVADGYNDRVQAFNAKSEFKRKWGGPFAMNIHGPFNGWFATVTNVSVGPDGNLFVADFYNHRIQKFSPDGTFLTAFGGKGSGLGEFLYPIAAAIAGDGTVFVADHGNNRIQIWRQD